MGFNRIYPLVNVYITMERSRMLLMGKLTNFYGHGFNSYVSHNQRVPYINVHIFPHEGYLSPANRATLVTLRKTCLDVQVCLKLVPYGIYMVFIWYLY